MQKSNKEKIAVMQAFETGAQIETRHREIHARLWSKTTSPGWDWKRRDYRVKPGAPFKVGDYVRTDRGVIKRANESDVEFYQSGGVEPWGPETGDPIICILEELPVYLMGEVEIREGSLCVKGSNTELTFYDKVIPHIGQTLKEIEDEKQLL